MTLGPSAHELALASKRAYKSVTISVGNCQVLVIERPDYIIVAFRGTEKNFGDWATDLRGIPWYVKEIDAWCHSGFAKSVRGGFLGGKGVWSKLRYYLLGLGSKPIYLTGHSLGGAQVVILYAIMLAENELPYAVKWDVHPPVTFGAPKAGWLGGKVGVKLSVRYVYGNDVVPKVPWILFGHEGILMPVGIPSTDNLGPFLDHRIAGYIEET